MQFGADQGLVYVGIPLWIGSFTNHSIEEISKLLLDNKIDLVELSIDYPWPQKQEEFLKKVISSFTNDFKIAIHAPWRDLPLASPYNNIRRAVVNELLEIIDDIYNIYDEIEYIVFHPLTMQRIELFNNRRDAINALRNSLIEIVTNLPGKTYLLIENLTRGFGSKISNLVEAVDSIGQNNIGLCLDIGHLASRYIREIAESNIYSDFYDYLKDVLGIIEETLVPVIHIHDVDDKGREHLIIGDGSLSFKTIYKLIRVLKPKYIVYEMFRSRKTKININEVAKIIGGQKSWVKVYLV